MNIIPIQSFPKLCEWPKCSSLYWRDYVMLTALVISVASLAIAIFQGFLLLTITSFVSMIALGFGAYYVSRYAELTEMKAQLETLQGEVISFHTENTHLAALNTSLETSLQHQAVEFEIFRNANQDLVLAEKKLSLVSKKLSSTSFELRKQNNRLKHSIQRQALLQHRIKREVQRLRRISSHVETATHGLAKRVIALPISS